uniref:Uncharacterized protein n=1 Tax=Anguilla anguilla TaxID=7936 RepID=A0A0E9QVQ5_ANGAN
MAVGLNKVIIGNVGSALPAFKIEADGTKLPGSNICYGRDIRSQKYTLPTCVPGVSCWLFLDPVLTDVQVAFFAMSSSIKRLKRSHLSGVKRLNG